MIKLLALLAAQWWLGRRGLRALRAFKLPAPYNDQRPPISIVIPARNEARRLPHLLASLHSELRQDDELVVVDDSSTDGTVEMASSAGARVVKAGDVPAGWLGKSYACWRGAMETGQRWLLFVDADVVLMPGALDRALGHAGTTGVECLSALGRQRLVTAWEKLLVPFAYRHYFAGHGATATINGQFVLITRSAYEKSGGHEAVKGSVAEDVDFARVLNQHGMTFTLINGRTLFSVRMYESLGDIVEGFGKNSTAFLKADPVGGLLTVLSTILASAPHLALIKLKGSARAVALLAVAFDIRSAQQFEEELTGRRSSLARFAQWLAQPLFVFIALRSLIGRRAGLSWKGRQLH